MLVAIVSGVATALGNAALDRVGETVRIWTTALCRGLGAIIAIAITAFSAAIAACLALMDVIVILRGVATQYTFYANQERTPRAFLSL